MENEDRREIDSKRFKFDASINIAHILTTLALVFSMFNWGSSINAAIAVNTSDIKNIKEARSKDREELMDALKEINHKLDELNKRK
jgi:predicted metal-dependent RNase